MIKRGINFSSFEVDNKDIVLITEGVKLIPHIIIEYKERKCFVRQVGEVKSTIQLFTNDPNDYIEE